MQQDIIALLEEYISADNPRKWQKLQSNIESRRLELMLLKEILLELKKLNEQLSRRPKTK